MSITRRGLAAFPLVSASLARQLSVQPGRLLNPPSAPIDAVVDSDTYNEIDDQFAVAYALLSAPRINVEAIYAAPYLNERSTSPADGMKKSYDEILRILARMNRDSKGFVFGGSERFMGKTAQPVESPAARDLVGRAMKSRNSPLYVITVGAPTNVSSAILMEPKIIERIVVVWLGGQPYDFPTAREFNLFQDIPASQTLYDSGVALFNVPTRNVSEHLRTTVYEVDAFLKGRSSLAEYLRAEFAAYAKWKSPKPDFAWSKVIWDISAVAWLIEPKWVPSKVVPSPVLTAELTYRSQTDRHSVRVATGVNRDAIFNDLFQKIARG
ncbi:MAG TPA: nucleoside hydrolase [Bryobacteraceae bacterium]|nr:nucleoside hydrolase [Bryobacteraceae bacterium]